MATSRNPIISSNRVPLRLRLSPRPGRDRLDGGWWPQSRNLAVELADLVNHFPGTSGRIVRVLVSAADWDTPPRSVLVARGYVQVGTLPSESSHVIQLRTAERIVIYLLVVPPGTQPAHADHALRTASTPGADNQLSDEVDPESIPRARMRLKA